jgi:16S rRNA (guanine966-N2)-methyltransferase
MRIIAGIFRSRPLQAPAGLATRPTSDRLRETLFNVLAPRIEGARFLDLYAGSGAVGLEALSRGAEHVVFVERVPAALKVLRANLDKLGVKGGFEVHAGAVREYLRRVTGTRGFDVVFLDPPYDAVEEYERTLNALGGALSAPGSPRARDPGHPPLQMLAADAVVIAEHRRKQHLEDSYGALKRTRLLEQGDAALSFYAVGEPVASS